MSHAMLFELDAVAETAQIALAWGITIRQNRGDTTAREPRTYHGRGFSLSATPERRSTLRPCVFDRASGHRCPRRAQRRRTALQSSMWTKTAERVRSTDLGRT